MAGKGNADKIAVKNTNFQTPDDVYIRTETGRTGVEGHRQKAFGIVHVFNEADSIREHLKNIYENDTFMRQRREDFSTAVRENSAKVQAVRLIGVQEHPNAVDNGKLQVEGYVIVQAFIIKENFMATFHTSKHRDVVQKMPLLLLSRGIIVSADNPEKEAIGNVSANVPNFIIRMDEGFVDDIDTKVGLNGILTQAISRRVVTAV